MQHELMPQLSASFCSLCQRPKGPIHTFTTDQPSFSMRLALVFTSSRPYMSNQKLVKLRLKAVIDVAKHVEGTPEATVAIEIFSQIIHSSVVVNCKQLQVKWG